MLFLLILACHSEPDVSKATEAPPARPSTVLLVTWDTTRADALSCYAEQLPWRPDLPAAIRPRPSTPQADQLAAGGVRFAWALSSAPTTLSSHTAMFSGEDSHTHQVVRNGFPVPGELPLLTERFAAAGWDTVAVVASSALERDMGLDRGFRVYQDHKDGAPADEYIVPASQVVKSTLAALDGRSPEQSARPLFLFVHFYDVHMPWVTAPADVRARFVDPSYDGPVRGIDSGLAYLTEHARNGTLPVADARQARGIYLAQASWVDKQTSALLSGLVARGLMRDAVVAVTADHGEMMDDGDLHPYSHGSDVDLSAIHVPLVLSGTGRASGPADGAAAGPGQVPTGTVIDRQVRLVDLGATLLGLAGLDPTLGQGEDLRRTWQGTAGPVPPSFAEGQQPDELDPPDRWQNLVYERAVAKDGLLYLRAPWEEARGGRGPRLYEIAAGQPEVQQGSRPDDAADLAALLDAWDAAAPPHRAVVMAEQTVQGLKALGYIEE